MDCLITTTTSAHRRVVSVAGRLSLNELAEFLDACAGQAGPALVINLADLMSIDAAAAMQVSRLRSEGATLVAVPPYIQLLIDRDDYFTSMTILPS